ncbi:hypothetical protein F7725_008010 [Dissostichus mawsoni]|uniref:Uncharacterized protein n=1 Tax=Dissostichus mawsoni TaxID=36200 RepID=A0A7J5Y8D2_DISMA|nr:hypothetical protein F7725_008010 [Dissostichus mawsoni]
MPLGSVFPPRLKRGLSSLKSLWLKMKRSDAEHRRTYLDDGSESLVMPIIRRHETLSITHRDLLQRWGHLEEEVEQGQRQLQIMKQEHSIKKLVKEVGCLLMAINNLADLCYIATYGPLENMNILTKMDMEYIQDKADTERRARRLMESGSAITSRTALTDKREKGSIKNGGRQPCLIPRGHFYAVPRAHAGFREKILQTCEDFSTAGFDESSFKHHLNTVVTVLEQCQADEQEDTLLRLFNEQRTSDSVVQYLRLLTSAHLQNQAEFFCHFVEAPNLLVYCHQEVEAMAMECDHVDILALSQALDICIHIVSMEGDEQQLAHHVIPEGAEPSLHLLYQTSHYNILYPRLQH